LGWFIVATFYKRKRRQDNIHKSLAELILPVQIHFLSFCATIAFVDAWLYVYKCVLVVWVLLNLLPLGIYHAEFAFVCLVSFRTCFHLPGFIVLGIVSSIKFCDWWIHQALHFPEWPL